MATYAEISDFVKKRYGKTVKTCWIAHAKEKCGLKPKKAPNRKGKNAWFHAQMINFNGS